MEIERPRSGRKAVPANQDRRASLGFKITPATKDKLVAAARANGRTQSQEAEWRIERSFDTEGLLADTLTLACGNNTVAGIVLAVLREFLRRGRLAALVNASGDPLAKLTWYEQSYAYDQALRAAVSVLEAFRPPGDDPAARKRADETVFGRAPVWDSRHFLAMIKDSPNPNSVLGGDDPERAQHAAEIGRLLGSEMLARIRLPFSTGDDQ